MNNLKMNNLKAMKNKIFYKIKYDTNFLLLLTIIVIFSISILIYIIINNKEGFKNIDDSKDNKKRIELKFRR